MQASTSSWSDFQLGAGRFGGGCGSRGTGWLRAGATPEWVPVIKERWRTERMYEDLKGELGLDHFEGRSFPGWHHHVSVAICCYAFVVAERARAFPPSTGGKSADHPLGLAA
jgi:SRSO17 transposase